MNWKFWEKVEHRDFTSVLIEAFLQRAASVTTGLNEVEAFTQGAIEAASGWWARGFMAAVLTPDIGIGAAMLAEIGRGLCRRGESVWYIDYTDSALVYRVVSSYEVRTTGGIEYYQVTYSLPDRLNTENFVPPGRVLHFRYSIDPVAPWRGVGPLTLAGQTVDLLAKEERNLRAEMASTVGNLLPQPNPPGSEDVNKLKESLRGLDGRTALVQTQKASWGQQGGRNDADWRLTHMGAAPTRPTVILREQVQNSVYAACGVPPGMFTGGSESSIRDAWRLFLAGTITPFMRVVVEEIKVKTGRDVQSDLSELRVADVATNARAAQSLVTAGFSLEAAARMSGFQS